MGSQREGACERAESSELTSVYPAWVHGSGKEIFPVMRPGRSRLYCSRTNTTSPRSLIMSAHKGYLPAAGHDFFLPLYDPLTRLLGAHKDR